MNEQTAIYDTGNRILRARGLRYSRVIGIFMPCFRYSLVLATVAACLLEHRCEAGGNPSEFTIVIDPLNPVNGRTFQVRNQTPVTIVVRPKSPFETCSMSVKERKPIVEENAFQTLVTAITQAGIPIALMSKVEKTGPLPTSAALAHKAPATALDKLAHPIETRLYVVNEREKDIAADIKQEYDDLNPLVRNLADLRRNPSGGITEIGAMSAEFDRKRNAIINDIDAYKTKHPDVPEAGDVSDLIKDIADLINKNADVILAQDGGAERLIVLEKELASARSALSAINDAVTALASARSKLYAQRDFLIQLPAEFEAKFSYSDINAVISQEVSCVDRQSNEMTDMGKVAYTVEFRDLPRAALSVGALVSTLDKREIGSVNVKDTTSVNGFVTKFGEVDRAGLQIIPFSFLNVRLRDWRWGHRDVVLAVSEGFGINPNNGGKDPEFFSGLSLGIGDFYLHVGGHHGRWQELGGGFGLGEVVPEKLATIPVLRRYTTHLGFAVSFHIPPK